MSDTRAMINWIPSAFSQGYITDSYRIENGKYGVVDTSIGDPILTGTWMVCDETGRYVAGPMTMLAAIEAAERLELDADKHDLSTK